PALFRFGAISPGARLRLAAEPFLARRADKDESVLHFASRHIGDEAARALVGAAVRGIFAGDASRLSGDAAFPAMRPRERRHRSLFVAMMGERKAPGGGTLWSFRRGMGALVDALVASTGSSLRLRTPVLGIEPLADGSRPRWRVSLASGESLEVDAVILA